MILNEIIASIQTLQVIGKTDDLQNLDIRHLLTDSRQLNNEPESTLFFALKTHKNDGANYIPQLLRRGVKAFVVEKSSLDNLAELGELAELDNLVILVVEDTLAALQALAIASR